MLQAGGWWAPGRGSFAHFHGERRSLLLARGEARSGVCRGGAAQTGTVRLSSLSPQGLCSTKHQTHAWKLQQLEITLFHLSYCFYYLLTDSLLTLAALE